ncbi:carbon-nitrogen hydrolase [Aspergillus granulosus]|uniref:nitrilase n=1 Tax=Aspergillus granulosus TaxID=176169 RepID=A0ABR4HY09_9EURO
MPSTPKSRIIKAAAVQAEPVWFDLRATVAKTCDLIKQAASQGAEIVAFPEAFIPGYPAWIWARSMDPELTLRYINNSLTLDSDEMRELQACAAENNIVVCLGYSERRGSSLYIGQCTINNDGELLTARRKLKPVHMEKTVFGDGDGPSLDNVAQTAVGNVGVLSCGDHYNPLLVFNTYSQGEEIHVSAWPPIAPHGGHTPYSMSGEAVASMSSVYSMQAQVFTLHSTAVISQSNIEKFGLEKTPLFNTPGGGNARIYAPDGRLLTTDLPPAEEGMVFADLDLDWVIRERAFLDNAGHLGKPEVLWLGRDSGLKGAVREGKE